MAPLDIIPGQSGYMNLTSVERDTIERVERFGASLSLLGVLFIFVTYGFSKRVRSVPNTFIFFASIANVGASVACCIGYAGITAGDDSHLCRAQAFLLEMFMQSDPWWSFAMAINVYMVFFMAYNPNNFHKHLWAYCLLCFGVPAIPAFICLFYAPDGQPIYGNATLWCWIGDSYNRLRIYTYYVPIWLCIVLSAVIYVAVGYHVFHQRNQLRNLTLSTQAKDTPGNDLRGSGEKTDDHPGSYGTVTTEVQVTAEQSSDAGCCQPTPPSTPSATSIAPVLPRAILPAPSHHPWASEPPHDPMANYDPESGLSTSTGTTNTRGLGSNSQPNPFTTISSISSTVQPTPKSSLRQRVLSSLNLTQAFNSSIRDPLRKFRYKLRNLDPIKLAYLRTSFVFAISVLVTWTPSSINRVYSTIYPTKTSYGLNLASAVVLPLQGLWNAVIFTATSWTLLKEEWTILTREGWKGSRGRRRRDDWVPGIGMDGKGNGVEFQFRERLGSGQFSPHLKGTGFHLEVGGGQPQTGSGGGGGGRGMVRVIRGGSL
ncbi:putative G-protein coupled receptor [Podospora fimiseda]|uniref:G-protein coupled receptor n=1 Tax=Podospora fimiseda TaxID=252190 RepID=A0AAN7BP11_9PEZI|nr:putative G-protein coupled receptor [Podospora fimiseda]